MSDNNYPKLPENDSRTNLIADLGFGGIYGYGHARGIYDSYQSTSDFEDAVLYDVTQRATAISYQEADEAHAATVARYEELLRKAYALAVSYWDEVPSDLVPVGYAEQMNDLCGQLADLGIEV